MTARAFRAAITVANRLESIRPAAAYLVRISRSLAAPPAEDPMFEVALFEALSNAWRHGAGGDRRGAIRCELEVEEHGMTVRIFDRGSGFDVDAAGRAGIAVDPECPETLPEAGFGLPIIRTVFPSVRAIRGDDRFGVEFGVRF